ncbi:MAG: MFS transporter [Eubacteriales bacterium]|nr:MFS transporter [Eubacteriales bacterium]
MDSTKNRSRLAVSIEIVMFFTYAFFAVNWIAGSTLTPQIMDHFHLESFASATLISTAITVAKIIGNFAAAWFLNKLLPKKAIGLGSFLILFGSVAAILAPAYSLFVIGRFIMGFGGAIYVVYFSPMVIHYFTPEQRPTISAINGVAYNVGSIIAMLLVAPVINWLQNWKSSMTFFAAISGVLFVIWLFLGEDFPLGDNSDKELSLGGGLKQAFNWILPLTYSGLLTLYIVVLTMFPQANVTAVDSKWLSTLMAVGGVVGSILAILLNKAYKMRLPVIRWCGLGMTAVALIMFRVNIPFVSYASALALGILMFLPVTSLVQIPVELPDMTPGKIATTMGLFWAISYIIETIVYTILGKIVDNSGFDVALMVAAIFSLTFFIGSFLLPETGKPKKA